MNAVSPTTATAHLEPLRAELERLIEVYTIAAVLEQTAVCCEIKASHEMNHGATAAARQIQGVGLDLMTLSERVYAL